MKQFLDWWLERPVSFLILNIIIIILGFLSVLSLPLELSPEVELPQVSITVYYPDSSPEMIEALITSPIESRMQELSDLRKIESVSSNNSARVTLQFDRKADMAFVVFRINEILSDYQSWLPEGAFKPQIQKYIPEEFKSESFLSYRLLTDLPENELYRMVQDKVKRPLLNVPGVSSVEIFGLKTPQVEILVNLRQMNQYGISLNTIQQKLSNAKMQVGKLKNENLILPVSMDLNFKNIEEIKDIPFKISETRLIHLKDFAIVMQGYQPLRFKKRINGKHTILISIEREKGSNTISVADRVFKVIRKIEKQLPKGNQLILVDDASKPIRKALNDLLIRTAIALASMFFLLILVLRRLRYTFIIITSILLSIASIFILTKFIGYSLNLVTLAGLALGLGFIIDNSILVFDAVESSTEKKEIIVNTIKIIFPVFASTLTTLVALLPFIFLHGIIRTYYIPFAFIVTVALLSSVFFSFIFIPAAFRHLNQNKTILPGQSSFFQLHLENLYGKILFKIIRLRKVVIVLFILSFGIPLWLLPQSINEDHQQGIKAFLVNLYNNTLGSEFYQSVREYTDPVLGGSLYLFFNYVERGEPWRWWSGNKLYVYIRMPHGSDLGISEKIILEFEKIALAQEGIDKVETTISPSAAYLSISFKKETLNSFVPYYLKELLIQRATKVGGVYISVSGFGDPYSSGFYGTVSNFRIKLTGYSYTGLKTLALRLKKELEKNIRVQNIDINAPLGFILEPLYDMQMDMDKFKLGQMGLTPKEVIPLLRLYTSERLTARRIKIGYEEKFLSIKSQNYERLQLDELKSLWFRSNAKTPFRLNQFSSFQKKKVLNEIHRENQEYIRMFTFDYLGPYHFGTEYLNQVLKNFRVPVGYKVLPFYWREKEKDNSQLILIVFLGLLFIYMVTASLYESFLDPLLIFLTIPSGLAGIFLIFYFTDTIFTKSAYIGVLFISGIVVNNSIILVSKYKQYFLRSHSIVRTIIRGNLNHFRPIFLTTFTTVLGFLPMILLSEQNADNIWYTLALTGLGGMISSFLFILFVLPALFYSFHKKRKTI
ncbi:efflux RND transporter permease subunit [Calditrichota bacterium LG25]